jgi:hypothetical protein
MIEELAGDAHISFEGNLRRLPLLNHPGVSDQPTATLERNTVWSKQDFIVIPLNRSSVKEIVAGLGETIPKTVLHVQIEKAGVVQFAAFDNFHPECILFGSAVRNAVLESLVSRNIIQPAD